MTEQLVNITMPRTEEQNRQIRERTRKLIIDTGLKLFAVKGYYGTSIADIAKQAGISKGLAYNYFKSKIEIAEAILLTIGDILSQFDQLFESINDPYEVLQQSIKVTLQHLRENEEFWRLYMSFINQIEMAELAKKVFGKIIEKYIKYFTDVFKKIGAPNPEAEAFIFGSILDGVPFDYLFGKESYPLKAVEKQLLKKYGKETLNAQFKFQNS